MPDRKAALVIFIGLFAGYCYIFPHWVDWNQNSHFDLTVAIVRDGTLTIDAYLQNTGDYALFNGHAYTDKAPGLSLLGVPVYALFAPLTQMHAFESLINTLARSPAATATINRPIEQIQSRELGIAASVAVVTWLTVALPSALLGVILFVFLGWLNYPARIRALAVLIYGFATPAFTYSATLYGHQIAAVLLFGAFAWLFALRRRRGRGLELFGAGDLLGWAVITEYPSVVIAAMLGLYAIWSVRPRTRLAWLIAGGVWPLLLLGAYNTAIFGSPLVFGYQYTADPRWHAILATGFFSASLPTMEAIWGLTFSPFRGLFFGSPILLLAIPGLILLRRSRYRAEWVVTLGIAASFYLLITTSAQWWGGWAAGPRYLVPMLPFLVWPLTATLTRIEQTQPMTRRWLRAGVVALTLVSIVVTWSLTAGGQYYAPDNIHNPLIDYSLPRITAGDVARNWGMISGLPGAASLIPLAAIVAATGLGVWIVTNKKGATQHVGASETPDA